MKNKICQSCGRPFDIRKKWIENWNEVKYCSSFCQRAKTPNQLMGNIIKLLNTRKSGKTICPSEVLQLEHKKNPEKMEQVRRAARLLVHENKIVIMQKGKVVDPNNFKGPIRLKLK